MKRNGINGFGFFFLYEKYICVNLSGSTWGNEIKGCQTLASKNFQMRPILLKKKKKKEEQLRCVLYELI